MEKDHLEILMEDIRGKFDLVLEGHDTLRQEIRDTREELCEKINLVDFKVETLNKKIDGVDANLNRKIDSVEENLNRKIDGVESRLSNEIRATNQKIESVRDSLDQKIDSVEARLSEKIDAVAADLAAHRADTEGHRTGYRISESRD
ncbi:MAG: hypothetical protein FJ117_22240 [Deltaproteobacteria bacterium]|nr:hypothetical protein [Deltaproteobacteria bacterium]